MEILFYLSIVFMKFPFIYLSMISIMIFFLVIKWVKSKEINIINFLVIVFLLFLLLHLIFISNINLLEILNAKYFRTEGRIFFTFIPFLYFSTFGLNEEKMFNLLQYLYYTFAFFALMSIVHLMTPLKFSFLFYGPMELFSGLFPTKNSAGNFIGFIIISFFFTRSLKNNKDLLILILMITVFLLANSRQAIFGIFLTSFFYMFKYSRFNFRLMSLKKIIPFLSIPVLVMLSNSNVITRIFSIDFSTINIFYRINSWLDAINLFVKSPILGIGFNRFGDFNKEFIGLEGFFYFARDGLFDWLIHYNHPHNQYLLILAETGLIGITLYLLIFYYLFKTFNKSLFYKDSQWANLILVYSLSLGIFGNGIEAPSVGLPFGLIIGSIYFNNTKQISYQSLLKNIS